MESEGPYSYSSVAGKIVEDAKDGSMAQAMITKALKDAHAEGRKSMEKDFRELLHLANVMSEMLKADSHSPSFEMRFIEWKKVRGIE